MKSVSASKYVMIDLKIPCIPNTAENLTIICLYGLDKQNGKQVVDAFLLIGIQFKEQSCEIQ